MPISLKHINTSDSDTIKLDNVNYNFDQLVANGGGSRGPQGPIGQTGVQGTTGSQGYQGSQGNIGFQGDQGPTPTNYWKNIPAGDIDSDTIIPFLNIGDQFAPVVNIGYVETDPEYGEKLQLVNGKTPFQWNINRRPYSFSNLQFLNSDVSGKQYDFKLEKSSIGKQQMTIGFFNPNDSTITYFSEGISFRSSILATDSLYVSSSETFFKKPTVINSPTVIKNRLVIENADAGINNVALSYDDDGLVKFKNIKEIEGTVPFGTIVSILPSIFADDYSFINTELVVPDNDAPVRISAGKGVGDYAGWYLCNGKIWRNETNAYTVPVLGKFSYSIQENPWSESATGQGSINLVNTQSHHITGGSNTFMDATTVVPPGLVYNVTSTVETSNMRVFPTSGYIGEGQAFRIKQLPQIIYLEKTDLYWFDIGTGQNPPVILEFRLDDSNENIITKLTPDPYPLATITDKVAGAPEYSFTSTVVAPFGYYWNEIPDPTDFTGLPGYASITNITTTLGIFRTEMDVTITISSHPSTYNLITLGIDTEPFISSKEINKTMIRLNTSIVSCPTPTVNTIQYSFATNIYTFQLVFTANSFYIFTANPLSSTPIYYADDEDNFFTTPRPGGGNINILNWNLTNGNKILTVNLSLTGIDIGDEDSYSEPIRYVLNLNLAALAPKITNWAGYPVMTNNNWSISTSYFWVGSSSIAANPKTNVYEEKWINVANRTGATVYIWVEVWNGDTLNKSPTITAPVTGGFKNFPNSAVWDLKKTTSSTTDRFVATPLTLVNNASITGIIYRLATLDSLHSVSLWWSKSAIVPTPNSPSTGQQIYTITPGEIY